MRRRYLRQAVALQPETRELGDRGQRFRTGPRRARLPGAGGAVTMLKRYFWLAYLLLVTAASGHGCRRRQRLRDDAAQPTPAAACANASRRRFDASRRAHGVGRLRHHCGAQLVQRQPAIGGRGAGCRGETRRGSGTADATWPAPDRNRVGERANQQYAIIEDLQRGGSQDLYQIGDVVQRAAIVDIRPECVLLDTRRQREKLCFDYDSPRPRRKRRAAPPRRRETRNDAAPAGESASDDIVRVDQGTWRVKRELITEQFADLGTLSRQVRVTPHSIQGRPSGFRLTRLRPGLLQRIGLLNGDVLQRVNGLDINSPEEALRAYQAVQSEPTVRLEILRRNSPTTLTYEIR